MRNPILSPLSVFLYFFISSLTQRVFEVSENNEFNSAEKIT